MKRYSLVPMTGSGTDADPRRPNVAGSYVAIGERNNHVLIKQPMPDGTAATASTIADLNDDDSNDVTATTLTQTRRTTIKTFLTNNGIDTAQFDLDGVIDRRQLLRFLLRRWLEWNADDFQRAIKGFDVVD